MKIHRIAEALKEKPKNDVSQESDPISQEIMQTYQKIINAVGVINQSLSILEKSGTDKFLNKKLLINAIQNGDIANFDISKANEGLTAMQAIIQSVNLLNQMFYFLKQNETTSSKFNVDIAAIYQNVVQSLNSGDYTNLVTGMEAFKSALTSQTGTKDI